MIRIWTGFTILAAGAGMSWSIHAGMEHAQTEAIRLRSVCEQQAQLVAKARIQLDEMEKRFRELKDAVDAEESAQASSLRLIPAMGRTNLSADEAEQLLAQLGFNWNTTGDYVVISKSTLQSVDLSAIDATGLTDVGCGVLAITPEERASINSLAQQLSRQYAEWLADHLRRETPSGNEVARYAIPEDPAFSMSLSNKFTSGISAILGDERGTLLRGYSLLWMAERGMSYTGPMTLIVSRYPDSLTDLRYSIQLPNRDPSPGRILGAWFPPAFRPAFPGGWKDISVREGFQLPPGLPDQPVATPLTLRLRPM